MGPAGPTGPSNALAYIDSTHNDLSATLATLTLNAGSYVFNAKVQLNRLGTDSSPISVECVLSVEDPSVPKTVFDVADDVVSGTSTVLPLATAVDLSAVGGSAALNCTGTGVDASNVTLVAIQVGTLTQQ